MISEYHTTTECQCALCVSRHCVSFVSSRCLTQTRLYRDRAFALECRNGRQRSACRVSFRYGMVSRLWYAKQTILYAHISTRERLCFALLCHAFVSKSACETAQHAYCECRDDLTTHKTSRNGRTEAQSRAYKKQQAHKRAGSRIIHISLLWCAHPNIVCVIYICSM